MKISQKNLLTVCFLFLLLVCILCNSKKTAEFAYIGLNTWYLNMIPSLFPFMVLLNLLISTGLSYWFMKPFSVFLKPFRNTEDACFVLFFGFLCGFPLGAKCVVDLYRRGRLSEANSEYLLSFTNNIGPAYFCGFVLGQIYLTPSFGKSLFVMYGLPLLYGLFLRHTRYRRILDRELMTRRSEPPVIKPVLQCLPDAISSALTQITVLGGYMIVFNALRILPELLFTKNPYLYLAGQSILEISGGLLCIKTFVKSTVLTIVLAHTCLAFGGLSCFFQTTALFQHTPFSGKKYMLHKLLLCSISMIVSYVLFR